MKNYRIILGSFIVSALFLSSCQDIDLLPKDNMPDELFWKTPDDFEKEVNWLYTRTETFGTKDTDSDIAYELNENTTSNGTLIAPNTDALWDSTFIDLRQSNMIIEKSQTYEGDPSEIERYVAGPFLSCLLAFSVDGEILRYSYLDEGAYRRFPGVVWF